MITLYHCMSARSFRPLWMLEELGLPYQLAMLPFPPRVLARSYLDVNPLGTIPLIVDGTTRMTESAAICQYLCALSAPTPLQLEPGEDEFGAYLNYVHFGEATLTFPQTAGVAVCALRARGAPATDGGRRLREVVPRKVTHAGAAACCELVSLRRPLHGRRCVCRLCADAGTAPRPRVAFYAGRGDLLGALAATSGLPSRTAVAGGRGDRARRPEDSRTGHAAGTPRTQGLARAISRRR